MNRSDYGYMSPSLHTDILTRCSVPYSSQPPPAHRRVPGQRFLKLPTFTAVCPIPEFQCIAAGQENGTVVMWDLSRTSFASPSSSSERPDTADRSSVRTLRDHTVLGHHRGRILCLYWQSKYRLLVTGSADGALKIWDPFGNARDYAIQDIRLHSGPVTSVRGHDRFIISGGADATVRVHAPDPRRHQVNLLPWFHEVQTMVVDGWASSIWCRQGSSSASVPDLIIGDSTGTLHGYTRRTWDPSRSSSSSSPPSPSSCPYPSRSSSSASASFSSHTTPFQHLFRQPHVTRLGILGITSAAQSEGVLLVWSHDGTVRMVEHNMQRVTATYRHEGGDGYCGVFWDHGQQEMLCVDRRGVLDTFRTTSRKTMSSVKILGGNDGVARDMKPMPMAVATEAGGKDEDKNREYDGDSYKKFQNRGVLVIATDRSVVVGQVRHEAPFEEHESHHGAVLATFLVDSRHTPGTKQLVTAGTDNMVYVWDVMQFSLIKELQWRDCGSDLRCMDMMIQRDSNGSRNGNEEHDKGDNDEGRNHSPGKSVTAPALPLPLPRPTTSSFSSSSSSTSFSSSSSPPLLKSNRLSFRSRSASDPPPSSPSRRLLVSGHRDGYISLRRWDHRIHPPMPIHVSPTSPISAITLVAVPHPGHQGHRQPSSSTLWTTLAVAGGSDGHVTVLDLDPYLEEERGGGDVCRGEGTGAEVMCVGVQLDAATWISSAGDRIKEDGDDDDGDGTTTDVQDDGDAGYGAVDRTRTGCESENGEMNGKGGGSIAQRRRKRRKSRMPLGTIDLDRDDESGNGIWIATGDFEGNLMIWRWEGRRKEMKRRRRIEGAHPAGILSLVWDGNFIITGGQEGDIRVWNLRDAMRDHRHHPDMTPVRILSGGHESDVTSMTMMTDLESGTGRLLSCGKDGKVMIWDYTKGTIIRVHRFGMELNTVQFNEVSREIYAGTETGTILRIATISEDEYRMRSRHHMLDGLAYPGDGQQGGGMTDAPELSALNAEIIDYILRN